LSISNFSVRELLHFIFDAGLRTRDLINTVVRNKAMIYTVAVYSK